MAIFDLVRLADGTLLDSKTFPAIPTLQGPKASAWQWFTRVDNPPSYNAELQARTQTGATLDTNARTRTINYAVANKSTETVFAQSAQAMASADLRRKIDDHLEAGELREAIETLMAPLFKKGIV